MTSNTKLGIVSTLLIHPDAQSDLRRLMVSSNTDDKSAGATILALLQQAKCDPAILRSLLEHGFGGDRKARYEVSKWLRYWNAGYNLWRLKIWTDPRGSLPYRIVYAYQSHATRYYVLAIVHREFDYRSDHEITQRVLKAYGEL